MSLKNRLRLSIVALVALVVIVLSALHLRNLAEREFEDMKAGAENATRQVQSVVIQRVTEQTAQVSPPPQTVVDSIYVWSHVIAEDSELPKVLQQVMASTKFIIEILITNEGGTVLAATNPLRKNQPAPELRTLEDWSRFPLWLRSLSLFLFGQEYQVPLTLGVGGRPVFTIRAVVSFVLLRQELEQQFAHLLAVSLFALVLAVLLAMFVSNLALRPLARISQALDRISRGESQQEAAQDGREEKEVAAVQSKLHLLGERFRDAQAGVSQLRENVEQLLQKLEEAVLLFDRNNRLVMASGAAERILGRDRVLMMGRLVEELFPAETPLGAAVQSAVQLRQPLRNFLAGDSHSGSSGPRVLVNVEILGGYSSREQQGALITLRDAESRRQLQSRLDVSGRIAAIGRLTGGVAHEIKNPLNAITLHLENLKSRLRQEQEMVPEEIEIIGREIARLDRVVKTFLDFTRPLDLKVSPLDLNQLVEEVALLLAGLARHGNVRVERDLTADPAMIQGDRDLLKQAILNVAVNGIEAMSNGGSLLLRTEQEGEEIVLSVKDQGPGIPPELQTKIFNLYFTTKPGGSGIGLAMTFRAVQVNNATIDFASEPGEGTTFRFRFPALAEPVSTASRPLNGTVVPS